MNILDWRDTELWKREASLYAGQFLNDNLIDKLRDLNVSDCYADDLSWLPEPEIADDIEISLTNHYSKVKCFHGARPRSVASYYEFGLLGQNREAIEDQFRQVFYDIDGSYLDQVILEHRERSVSEKGKIFFVCDDRELIEKCGHYLIQGSEYIMALAASLIGLAQGVEDYRLRLRENGAPTIFEVDLPISKIPNYQMQELVKCIIAEWAAEKLGLKDQINNTMGFVIQCDLEPANITAHHHPKKIKDPHNQYIWYIPDKVHCDVCVE